MPKLIVVGTYHDVQGLKKFRRNVNDPHYKTHLQQLMKDGVDFIFEEAGGEGPSVASEMVANDQYVDIDSAATEEALSAFREPAETNLRFLPPLRLTAENWREECWVKKIKAQQFKTGLVICGVAHSLSIAFRLRVEGFDVEASTYEPIDRLCSTNKACPKLHSLAETLCEAYVRCSKKFRERGIRKAML
jgi:hypothetical protein